MCDIIIIQHPCKGHVVVTICATYSIITTALEPVPNFEILELRSLHVCPGGCRARYALVRRYCVCAGKCQLRLCFLLVKKLQLFGNILDCDACCPIDLRKVD